MKCLLLLFLSFPVFADCKYSEGIQEVETGFLYSEDCHLHVGFQRLQYRESKKEIEVYKDLLRLGDEEIYVLEDEVQNWKQTTYKTQKEYQKSLDNEKMLRYFYFGLGVITPILINQAMEK